MKTSRAGGRGATSLRVSLAVIIVMVLVVSVSLFSLRPNPGGDSTSATGTSSSSTGLVMPSGSSSTAYPSNGSSPAAATPVPTGLIIPMFTNDSLKEVGQIIDEAQAHPNVPMTVVANPDDGPGIAYNATYGAGLDRLMKAGITVLGYDYTDWALAPMTEVEQAASDWQQWYGVQGIYLDQMYNEEYSWAGTYVPTYYSTLTSYIKSLGLTEIFANAGADVPYYFVGSVTTIGYFENGSLPSLSALGGWHTNYTKSNFAFFAYQQPSFNEYFVAAASDYVGMLYITNLLHPYPYSQLPSYFDQLVSTLASLVPVTIQTQTPGGSIATRGFEVTVTQPNGISTTSYSPSVFDVVSGSKVTVTVKNFGGYDFDHWSGGSTQKTITIEPTSAMTLTAFSKTSQTNASFVTIRTNETNSVPVQGIYTTASINGNVVASGYTPFTFVATKGVNYTLTMHNYGTYDFVSWANGITSHNITLVPDSDELVYAFVANSTTSQSSGPIDGVGKSGSALAADGHPAATYAPPVPRSRDG